MRSFPIEETLAAPYWRKLGSSVGAAYKKGGSVSVARVTRVLQTRQRRVSPSKGNRSKFKKR